MRFSIFAILAVVAALTITPALSAPLEARRPNKAYGAIYARDAGLEARANGQFTKALGNVANGATILSGLSSFVTNIIDGIRGRELEELQARELELEARANGQFTKVIGNVANGATVLSGFSSFVKDIIDGIKGRELAELEARALLARDLDARANGQFTKVLGNVANGASILSGFSSFVTNIIDGIRGRELEELQARGLDSRDLELEARGKFIENAGNLFSIVTGLGHFANNVINHFSSRDLEALFEEIQARAYDELVARDAIAVDYQKLNTLANEEEYYQTIASQLRNDLASKISAF
ncbi:hypothetical protein BXZ70DRAFT_910533 [Cristinia sonorae]|uniref:Uncharacterized protein n=1 Tax=Cristinia sonorae TaxID=1940300 RepID=A0A8K0UF37_9AGAR|nr:hypothetical protein BXZ70DRAFT_910533 [Cristinia sonorae]